MRVSRHELRCPAKYDPEEAKSDREKFREKVLRLMNNQLEVDYLQCVRLKDRTLVTYQGRELEEVPVPTKSIPSSLRGVRNLQKLQRTPLQGDALQSVRRAAIARLPASLPEQEAALPHSQRPRQAAGKSD